jgi:adenosylmethionine---8-amino-7-oxononanoate aminotransferase
MQRHCRTLAVRSPDDLHDRARLPSPAPRRPHAFVPEWFLNTQAIRSTDTPDDWVARSLRAVWHPCTQMKHHEQLPLVPIARGEGPWLYDRAGRRYLDAISSWWVNLFGHANRASTPR